MDERVTTAISNWAPRFTTNGVTAGDFARITAGLERWEDWCAAWSAVAAEHEELGRAALAAGREMSAGAHLAQAAVYYHFAKFLFTDDLAQMRTAHRAAVRCLDDALPYLDPPGRRIEIPFEGSQLAGVLRQPPGEGPHPVIIMLSGLDSAKEELRSTEELFLARGIATFSVDGPGQGEAEYDLAIRGDWEVPGAAIIDWLVTEPGLDPDRIGVWGVSLGGYYAPRVASGDDRVRACVALAGPYNFADHWDHRPALTREAFRVRSKSPDLETARAVSRPAQPGGPGGTHPLPAAGRDGQAGPADPVAGRGPAGAGGGRPGRAAAPGAGQPRLRQPVPVPPVPDRGLGRGAAWRADQADGRGGVVTGRPDRGVEPGRADPAARRWPGRAAAGPVRAG